MRSLLAVVVLCIAAARTVEGSFASTHPLCMLAPGAIGALAACAMCLFYLFRDDA